MAKKKVTDDPVLQVVYMGMRMHPLSTRKTYQYKLIDANREIAFAKKLLKTHVVGNVYLVHRKGESSFGLVEGFLEAVDTWKNRSAVVGWLREDVLAAQRAKSLQNRGKLRGIARQTVESLKSTYRHASESDKVEILQAIVQALEE